LSLQDTTSDYPGCPGYLLCNSWHDK